MGRGVFDLCGCCGSKSDWKGLGVFMAADVAALTRSFFFFFSPLLLFFLNDLCHFSVHVFIFSDLRTISFFFFLALIPR